LTLSRKITLLSQEAYNSAGEARFTFLVLQEKRIACVVPQSKKSLMPLSAKMNAALNEQIGVEYGAALQYIAIGAYFAAEHFKELSERFYAQAEEEQMHGVRLLQYIIESEGQVRFPSIPAPVNTFQNAEEAVQLSLDSEKRVTALINSLADLARDEADQTTRNMLSWFLTEQLEEVSSMTGMLRLVQRARDNLLLVEELLTVERFHRALLKAAH
jgi:bacterioferritin B